MTKQEYLDSLPFHRKASLYMKYLEYNKYYEDLERFNETDIEEAFDEEDFNSYEIADMIDRHSNCLYIREWETYDKLDDEYSLL